MAARADIDPRRLLAAVAAALSCLALFFWISGRDAFFLPTDIAYWYQDSLWLKACRSRPWTVNASGSSPIAETGPSNTCEVRQPSEAAIG